MLDSEKPVLKEEKTALKLKRPALKLKKPAQTVYTAAQLAANYRAFHTSYAIVAAALKLAGKDSFTFDEAKKLIVNFNNRK